MTEGVFHVDAGHRLFVPKGDCGMQWLPLTLEGKTLTPKQGDEVLAELVRQADA